MRPILTLLLGLAWLPLGTMAEVSPLESNLETLLAVKIRTVQHMALNPTLVRAVRRQNAQGLDDKEIAQRDREWQEAAGMSQFKWTLQQSKAGQILRRYVDGNRSFNEAFLTDEHGANVAAFPPTSDYFQGDEEKWSESFNDASGQIFLGPLELDESTGVYAVQVSAPVIAQGDTIGVLIVGVTLDYLEDKQAKRVTP